MSTCKIFLFIGGYADGEYFEVQTDDAGRPQRSVRIPRKFPLYKNDQVAYSLYRAEELREGDKSYWIYYSDNIRPGDFIAKLIAGYTPALHRRPKITR